MKAICKALAAAGAVLSAGVAQGQLVTNVSFTSVNSSIPDQNPVGLVSTASLSGLPGVISSVTVTLDITGGFNGDLYAYLAGPVGGFAVLLNRVGLSGGNTAGYANAGFDVTFSDAAQNIHFYQQDNLQYNGSGQLINTWAPDGRRIDPQSPPAAFDSTTPTADLSSFKNYSPDGQWTLFVSDVSGGGQSTLTSWELAVVTIPEPQTWMLGLAGAAALLLVNRWRKI